MTTGLVQLIKAPLTGAFFIVCLVSHAQLYARCVAPAYDETARIQHVYDGDTLRLTDGRKVRVIGINTPEMAREDRAAEPLAEAATLRLKQLAMSDGKVSLLYDRQRKDRYGRTLAHLFTDKDQNLAEILIEQGLGFAVIVPPNTKLADCYFVAERKARNSRQGIWRHAAYKPVTPAEISHTGFQVIEGKVTGIGQGKKRIWLDMGRQVALRIEKKSLINFEAGFVERLVGKRIRVRGWVTFYNKKYRMSVGHPLMIEVLE